MTIKVSKVLSFLAACLLLSTFAAAQLRQIAIVEIPGRPGFDSMAFAGKYLLMSHESANTLEIFDPTLRRVVAQVVNLSQPRGIAVDDQAGRVYIANAGNNTITEISTDGWKVLRSITVPQSPDTLLFVPQRSMLYAGNWHDRSLTAINLKGGAVSTLPLNGIPQGMVYDPADDLVFVSLQADSSIAAINNANTISKRFAINGPQPSGIAFNTTENRLYLAIRGAVLVLDPATGTEIARVPSPESVDALWSDNSSNSILTAAEDGTVSVIRSQGGHYVSEVEMKTEVRGHTIAFDSAKGLIYVPGGREDRSKLVILKRIGAASDAPQNAQQQPTQQAQIASVH